MAGPLSTRGTVYPYTSIYLYLNALKQNIFTFSTAKLYFPVELRKIAAISLNSGDVVFNVTTLIFPGFSSQESGNSTANPPESNFKIRHLPYPGFQVTTKKKVGIKVGIFS